MRLWLQLPLALLALLPGGCTRAKCYNFCHCLDSNWSINRMRGETVANELKRGAQMESLLCHPHTHTHSVRIRRSKRRLNIVYDMRYATPKRNNTNSNEHPGLHRGTESAIASVQFVRSTIAVAAARTCFIFGSSVRGGSSQNSVTG